MDEITEFELWARELGINLRPINGLSEEIKKPVRCSIDEACILLNCDELPVSP